MPAPMSFDRLDHDGQRLYQLGFWGVKKEPFPASLCCRKFHARSHNSAAPPPDNDYTTGGRIPRRISPTTKIVAATADTVHHSVAGAPPTPSANAAAKIAIP
jgi:hypothetical protein